MFHETEAYSGLGACFSRYTEMIRAEMALLVTQGSKDHALLSWYSSPSSVPRLAKRVRGPL